MAKESAARLGLVEGLPKGTELFYILKQLLGWKLARRLENFYYGNRLNRASIISKLKNLKRTIFKRK